DRHHQPGHPEPKHDQSYETEPVGRIHPISSARHPATLPRTGRSGGGYDAPPTAAPDTPVTIIIRDDAVRTARAWAGHRRAHRTSKTGSRWTRSSVTVRETDATGGGSSPEPLCSTSYPRPRQLEELDLAGGEEFAASPTAGRTGRPVSLRSSCPDSTVGLMTHRFSASMVAALLAAVLGIGHAAFSAYWAIGGTWLLDTIGGELERWGR